MGCSGLYSYVHKNFHIFGRIHNHQPLDVVIDATNAMFFFHNILSYKNVINGYNVDFLEDAVDAFFYFLEYNNFHITHIVFDGVVDWDKVDEFAVRGDKNMENNEKIWENGLKKSGNNNESISSFETDASVYINPVYIDVINEDDINVPDEMDTSHNSDNKGISTYEVDENVATYCDTVEAAGETLRSGMAAREKTIRVYYYGDTYNPDYFNNLCTNQISPAALAETLPVGVTILQMSLFSPLSIFQTRSFSSPASPPIKETVIFVVSAPTCVFT